MAWLEASGSDTHESFAAWLLESKSVMSYALLPHGCYVVQRVLELVRGRLRDELAAELVAHTAELCESPHGNHVLTKVIGVMPADTLGPLVRELGACGPVRLARHPFGCRVLELLLAHASPGQVESLTEKIIEEAAPLSRNQYGNFVVKALFERGTEGQSARLLRQLWPVLPELAAHRAGSHVVQKAIECSGAAGQRAVAVALAQASSPHSLVDVACSKYGSYVVEQLAALPHCIRPVMRRLAEGLGDLAGSEPGRRAARRCGLDPGPEPAGAEGAA